jgi:hypothetical protein
MATAFHFLISNRGAVPEALGLGLAWKKKKNE